MNKGNGGSDATKDPTRFFRTWVCHPIEYLPELFIVSTYVISQNNEIITRGCLAGAATFMLLRSRRIARIASGVYQRSYQLDSLSRPPPSTTRKALKFGLDVGLSALMGWSVCLCSIDLVQLGDSDSGDASAALTALPLLSGRSAIAEDLCPKAIDEIKRFPEQASYLKEVFGLHCELRLAYEDEIRKKQRLADGTPVSIPRPGVPGDRKGKDRIFEKHKRRGRTRAENVLFVFKLASKQEITNEDRAKFRAAGQKEARKGDKKDE